MYRGYMSKPGARDKAMRELGEENESLRGALQSVLLSLEAAVDSLIPFRPGKAEALVEEAIVVIREELNDPKTTT